MVCHCDKCSKCQILFEHLTYGGRVIPSVTSVANAASSTTELDNATVAAAKAMSEKALYDVRFKFLTDLATSKEEEF